LPADHERRRPFLHSIAAAVLFIAVCPVVFAADKVEGIVESVSPEGITVDSAIILVNEGTNVTGDVQSIGRAKVGYWAEAQGRWKRLGAFEAEQLSISRDVPGVSFADSIEQASAEESRKLNSSDRIYKDEEVTNYIRKVAMPLVPDYAWSDHNFKFMVIRDPSLNAFALPNGAIYVHTGLLAKLDNEAQLAVVLGHEISHVTQKHGQRQYKKSLTTFLPAQIGAMLLGVNLQKNTDNQLVRTMAGLGLQLGLSAAVNGYGRTLEDQADRVGLRYAVEAGYDPRQGPKVWDVFNDVYGDESRIENFFYGNHSTNAVRKENLRTEIHRHYAPQKGDSGDSPAGSARNGSRGRVEADSYQATMLPLIRDNAVDDFNLKRYRLSAKGFERVIEHRPGDPVAHHYMGRIILATDNSEDAVSRALSEYQEAISNAPDYYDLHRDLGVLYERMGRKNEARAHFRKYLDLARDDAPDRRAVERELDRLD
jgi:predicted Zn-dependent protease